MRVIYPYVTSFPEAVAALPVGAERIQIKAADTEAYWRLLREAWRSGDDFMVVEQDMVLPTGAVWSFERCPREWCGLPYFMHETWGCWHGTVRYRGSFTRRLPDLPDEIKARHWESLDSAWINHLRLAGYNEAHWHWPPARHLSTRSPERPSHMKCPACGTDIRPAIGQEIAALTDGGPFALYRATLRLTMTADVL
jgi:hypothetical protein